MEEDEPEEIDEAPIENYGDMSTQEVLSRADSLDTKHGTSSIISGLDTPNIDIRKQPLKGQAEIKPNMYDNSGKPLYHVLEPTQVCFFLLLLYKKSIILWFFINDSCIECDFLLKD